MDIATDAAASAGPAELSPSPPAGSTGSPATPTRTKLCGICRNRVPAGELKSGRCASCLRAYRRQYRAKQRAARAQDEVKALEKHRTAAWRKINRDALRGPVGFEEAFQELLDAYGGEQQLFEELRTLFEGEMEAGPAKRIRLMKGVLSLAAASDRRQMAKQMGQSYQSSRSQEQPEQ